MRMIFTVYGFSQPWQREDLATFFDGGSATDFALHPEIHGFEKRNVFMAAAEYDPRAAGYRYEPLAPTEELAARNGWARRAA